MRKQIVAGNWKMNLLAGEAYELAHRIERYGAGHLTDAPCEVVLAPPFPYLQAIADMMHLLPVVKVAAQNCHEAGAGAYTGEVSAAMLRSIDVDYVIIGHSERRQQFGEGAEVLRAKTDTVLESGLDPIFCCGEPWPVREEGGQEAYVRAQLEESLFHLDAESIGRCVIAYEPVWAIGTGNTATAAQAQEMHAFIRGLLTERYGGEVAGKVPLLYGGSVKSGNAPELFACPDVDGGLVGGASLDAPEFLSIVQAVKKT